jgi:colicin import membrane protein
MELAMAALEGVKRARRGALWSPIQIATSLLFFTGCTPEPAETAPAPIAEAESKYAESEQVALPARPSPVELYRRQVAAQEKEAEERSRRLEANRELTRLMSLQPDHRYVAWLTAIQEKVNDAWNQLSPEATGFECEIRVSLVPGMEVVNAEILRCNADDAIRSLIILAVGRASPLPEPPEPEMFERSIVFVFKPTD